MKSVQRNVQRGLTMLELMLVVMIIAVIGLVAVTRYMQAKDRGFVASAEVDLSSVRQAMAMYAADHDAYPADLSSVDELEAVAVYTNGVPYVEFSRDIHFRWLSYQLHPVSGYVLEIQANDHSKTRIRATANGVYVVS